MKKFLIGLGISFSLGFIFFFFIIVLSVVAFSMGDEIVESEQTEQVTVEAGRIIKNNQLYIPRYQSILNKYLTSRGYVSLERLIFYLQRTHNVLDTSKLSYNDWVKAYIENSNEKEKQMIPIKTICKKLNDDKSVPKFTVKSSKYIDVIDLCHKNGKDITIGNEFNENYYIMPFDFPLRVNFTITSVVFENRSLDFGLSASASAGLNFHQGWDLAVPIGTNVYSICDGVVTDITNTQSNDLTIFQSGNTEGNHMIVRCHNGLSTYYWHLKYKTQPFGLRTGSHVKKGDIIAKTSTTGRSSGPHLHLEMHNQKGKAVDAFQYIDFSKLKG